MAPPVVVSNCDAWPDGCARGAVGRRHEADRDLSRCDRRRRSQPLTHQNDALFAELHLGADRRGQLQEQGRHRGARPADQAGRATSPARRVPLLLRIHGGPNGQDSTRSAFERQWFAANGYAVLAVNYRGSAGRGDEVLEARSSPTGATTRWTICRPASITSSRWASPIPTARRRRLELRRHPHRLHDRQRHALQGGDQRRRHRVHRRLLRHRPVHHSVRLRDRPAVGSEGVGDVSEDLVSVPARRSHQDADAVPRRREATSTCRCRAASRCTRRCAAWASTRSS